MQKNIFTHLQKLYLKKEPPTAIASYFKYSWQQKSKAAVIFMIHACRGDESWGRIVIMLRAL